MDRSKKKNILLFGGAGFIGINLILGLIEKDDFNIHVYDKDFSAIEKIKNQNSINKIYGNFIEEKNFDRYLKEIDYIVHLIHTTIPGNSETNITGEIESNIMPSINLFLSAARNNVKKVIYISSGGKIYGDRDDHVPIYEDSKLDPKCIYGISKLMIEKYIDYISNNTGLNYVILRPSNPYGPNFYRNNKLLGLINVALKTLKEDDNISVWGGGSNIRDYIYIEDLTDAIYRALLLESRKNYIFNIGSGTGKSILEILSMVEKITNRKIKKEFLDSRKIDIDYNVLDITKAINILNWKPGTILEDGIKKTWDWANNKNH